MSETQTRGPGGLILFEAGLDPSRLELDGGPASWTSLPPVSLHDFADASLRGEDAFREMYRLLFLNRDRLSRDHDEFQNLFFEYH